MSSKLFLHSLFSVLLAGSILVVGTQVAAAQTQPTHSMALETGSDALAAHQRDGLIDLVAGLPSGTQIVVVGYAAQDESARPAAGLAAARALDAARALAAVASTHGVVLETSVEARLSAEGAPSRSRVEFHIEGAPALAQVAAR